MSSVERPEIIPESELEAKIMATRRWQMGAAWGVPRPGHPEGSVQAHIADVLAAIDRLDLAPEGRAKLRLVALVHDTFKNEVDVRRPRSGANHHAVIAGNFLAGYTDDTDVLEITELHDEAFNSWGLGSRRGDWPGAEARATRLMERLGPGLPLYCAFFRADNASGGKDDKPLAWFESLAKAR